VPVAVIAGVCRCLSRFQILSFVLLDGAYVAFGSRDNNIYVYKIEGGASLKLAGELVTYIDDVIPLTIHLLYICQCVYSDDILIFR